MARKRSAPNTLNVGTLHRDGAHVTVGTPAPLAEDFVPSGASAPIAESPTVPERTTRAVAFLSGLLRRDSLSVGTKVDAAEALVKSTGGKVTDPELEALLLGLMEHQGGDFRDRVRAAKLLLGV